MTIPGTNSDLKTSENADEKKLRRISVRTAYTRTEMSHNFG
jgi:hypothetical protein